MGADTKAQRKAQSDAWRRQALVEFSLLPEMSWLANLCRFIAAWSPFGVRLFSGKDGSLYQLRVYLLPHWMPFSVNLHHFFRSDSDVAYHNHPWQWALSLILVRGYKEIRYDPWTYETTTSAHDVGELNFIRRNTYHRVELFQQRAGATQVPLRPWTLIITGPRVKAAKGEEWGFVDAETKEYMHWEKFVNQPPSRHTPAESEPVVVVEDDPDQTDRFRRPAISYFMDADIAAKGLGFAEPEEPTVPVPLQKVEATDA